MHSAKQHNQQKCHHARSTQTMMRNTMARNVLTALAATAFALTAFSVSAAPIYWADWTTGQTTGAGFQAQGVITTPSSTINVTYTNPQGISFFQPSGGIDYYQNRRSNVLLGRDPAASPYTSAQVDNIPTGTDIIALNRAGTQTLTFSQAVANPVFAGGGRGGGGGAGGQGGAGGRGGGPS